MNKNKTGLNKVNIKNKMGLFSEYWTPKIVGDLNDSHIKLAKFKGEFTWHKHDHEDELFFVIKGKLLIKFRDQDIYLEEGEFLVIPKGVEHLPIAEQEVHVMLIEPKTTLNTGDVQSALTQNQLDRI
jgi:mannose-6-phosphate isomerase-like protein (cupin superfamily)